MVRPAVGLFDQDTGRLFSDPPRDIPLDNPPALARDPHSRAGLRLVRVLVPPPSQPQSDEDDGLLPLFGSLLSTPVRFGLAPRNAANSSSASREHQTASSCGIALLALHVAFCFPYMTVYLNELVGGPWNGTKFYHTLSDANVHKFRLTKWIEDHKAETIYLTDEYFQACKDLSPRIRPLPVNESLPKKDNVPKIPQGWYVVAPQNIHLDRGSAIYLRDKHPSEYVAPTLAVYDMRANPSQ